MTIFRFQVIGGSDELVAEKLYQRDIQFASFETVRKWMYQQVKPLWLIIKLNIDFFHFLSHKYRVAFDEIVLGWILKI